jgi:hypothetical protein
MQVRLPVEDALRLSQGVEVVIHAVGPNMNPQRANCIDAVGGMHAGGERGLAVALLEQTFSALFDQFASILLYAGQPSS